LAHDYPSYVTPESQEWEQNFKPHITIARDLSPKRYAAAKNDIGKDFHCTGIIRSVVLVVVENAVPEESNNPKNQTCYTLEK
jgi:2'-5' RNA ligase